MHPSEYGVMSRCERDHWWYVGLHSLAIEILSGMFRNRPNPLILDAGCGTGGFLNKYKSQNARFVGMEPSENAYPFLIQASIENLVRADMLRMPFRRESFDAVVSLDVLCVFQESDIPSSIREIVNVMKPDGRIILNLPAYPWLMSGHDRFVGNKSRFTARGVSDELTKAGLIIKYQGYRNSILFPFVAAARLLSRMKMSLFKRYAEPFQSDVKMPPEWINRILTRILLFENYFICRGWRFCFGLSVFIVAQKSD